MTRDCKTEDIKTTLADRAIIDDEEIINLERLNLDKFRIHQKQIEELNKKKRQILASAIVERQKKAKAESVKLLRIQKELEKLDQMLTVDVSLIRDGIEDSSRTYMDAEKRYNKAETEYIEAKMLLFKTREHKEQLTEHLYTVIQQNEIRKSQKLKDLMEKLELESEADDIDVLELVKTMNIPSLSVLNATPVSKSSAHTSSPPVLTPAPLTSQSGEQLIANSEESEKSQTENTSDPAADKSCDQLIVESTANISVTSDTNTASKDANIVESIKNHTDSLSSDVTQAASNSSIQPDDKQQMSSASPETTVGEVTSTNILMAEQSEAKE